MCNCSLIQTFQLRLAAIFFHWSGAASRNQPQPASDHVLIVWLASLVAGLSVQCCSLMHAVCVCVCEKGEQQIPEALTKYDKLVKKTKWRQYAVG
ncbi:hypothetical protein Tsp_10636 [Trichinella spiralis]|uniref:hypothetical protein n=1 Tax=Trichinella spiralis TaxID=6334 RepID=UPI0001EFDBB3|nr:hypothetical protein Tsp_10636 [Trichinella spiralis]